MELVKLDRFMRRKHAVAAVSFLFAASTFVIFAGAKWGRNPAHVFDRGDAGYLLGFVFASASCSALGVLAWRHLWRRGRTPAEVIVFDLGVRQFGIWAVLLSPLFVFLLVVAVAGGISAAAMIALLPVSVVVIAIMLPLGLWFGYILGYRRVGSSIAQLGGIDERSMPPPVSECGPK